MPTSRIIVIASLNMDIISQVERHALAGETIRSREVSFIPGGKGLNQAIAAFRLRGKVELIGKVGKDFFGTSILDFLRDSGLGVNNIFNDQTPTGTALIIVDQKGENKIYVSGGANEVLTRENLNVIEIKEGDLVLATLETPVEPTRIFFKQAKTQKAKTLLNATPVHKRTKDLFPFTDYLVVNETELALLTQAGPFKNQTEIINSMKKLKSRNKDMQIITTLGRGGVLALGKERILHSSTQKIKAVDTTAAGDCFIGAFSVALQEGTGIQYALNFANAAAGISVQRQGSSSSLPFREELPKNK